MIFTVYATRVAAGLASDSAGKRGARRCVGRVAYKILAVRKPLFVVRILAGQESTAGCWTSPKSPRIRPPDTVAVAAACVPR